LNGFSVSKSAKIGERPYPSPFHPVENDPKTGKIPRQRPQIPHQINKFMGQKAKLS